MFPELEILFPVQAKFLANRASLLDGTVEHFDKKNVQPVNLSQLWSHLFTGTPPSSLECLAQHVPMGRRVARNIVSLQYSGGEEIKQGTGL